MLSKNKATTKNKKKYNQRARRNRTRQTGPVGYFPLRGSFNMVNDQQIMPARKYATLTYNDGSPVRNAPGTSFLVYSMRINDLNDPDPLILSGSISNFKEMMQFYSYYRVLRTHVRWTVCNLETFPLAAFIVFSQTNLVGTIGSLADCQNAAENDFKTTIQTISGKGGLDRVSFNIPTLDIARLLGVGSQYRSDQSYSGLGLATPSIPLWANFIVYSPTGASMTNGYVNTTVLAFESEFFGRLNVRA